MRSGHGAPPADLLRACGVEVAYGHPFPGLPSVTVPARVAPLLAAAHERVHLTRAVVHGDDGSIRLPSGEAVTAEQPQRWTEPDADAVARLRAARRAVVVAGWGVVADGAVPSLHALAAAGSFGVVNSWPAKGVFDWRSRHHFATAGLQASDFELTGVDDADLVVMVGVSPRDGVHTAAPADRQLTVSTAALGPLAALAARPPSPLEPPPLRRLLTPVSQAGWESTAVPLAPAKVTMHYNRVLGDQGLVCADAGDAGFWVARTFTTIRLGTAVVAGADDPPGFAIACAIVARLRNPARPVLAAVDGPITEPVAELLAIAAELHVPVGVEVWDADGPPLTAEAHLERLHATTCSAETTVVSLATDPAPLQQMIAIAGPVVAWSHREAR